ncbi:ACT domain-containing protein [Ligilactobacillus ceti]|uniref:UPF0237 protein IV53_GL000149 n=1 Tax=Ligilactobacillus ceti DSM 22408 TaxID=1122146 RepID=A0A0R2KSW5_9LACO|nr:ACT domain-containing protein [Ligilactobacillus ceti]KRN89236.1 hypothetical protein IV53_GL000149 [Ligilactobacillus ceti DSM 22408]
MKAILTTVGKDKVGIIAAVSQWLATKEINIIDLSQTIMDDYFTMMMLVEVPQANVDFAQLQSELQDLSVELGVEINLRNAEIYDAMHFL